LFICFKAFHSHIFQIIHFGFVVYKIIPQKNWQCCQFSHARVLERMVCFLCSSLGDRMNHNLIGRITRESRVCVKQKQFRSFFAANAKEMGGAPEIGIPTGLPMLQHKSCLAQVVMQAMMSPLSMIALVGHELHQWLRNQKLTSPSSSFIPILPCNTFLVLNCAQG